MTTDGASAIVLLLDLGNQFFSETLYKDLKLFIVSLLRIPLFVQKCSK